MSTPAKISPEDSIRENAIAEMTALRFQPAKSLPMTILFLWLSGNEISIFTIMFVGMAFINPITSLIKTSETFAKFNELAKRDKYISSCLSQSKMIYAGLCMLAFGVALMKLQLMSLLPVCKMDWMSSSPAVPAERSFGVFLS